MLSDSRLLEEVQAEFALLPDKMNFKIGEAAKLLGIKPHILRYWEEEFSLLKPRKFTNNQRLYFKKDMELLILIKSLLYQYNLSVKGVRKHLSKYYYELNHKKSQPPQKKQTSEAAQKLKDLIEEINEIKKSVQSEANLIDEKRF
ncbi:MAG: MerR family transcriptional regulator [Bdellovibrionales bacterium]|nr:MerR family transcriptional regulator [Bdellovibrionales bacterium]